MKLLFVCSTGGHLAELLHWSQRLQPAPTAAVWATHERSNSTEIGVVQPGAEVRFVRSVEPRQASVAARMIPTARQILREERPDAVLSTGAAVAVPFAIAARAASIPFVYVESAARIRAPSLTGRLISGIDGRQRWCQADPAWPGWGFAGSVFDAFTGEAVDCGVDGTTAGHRAIARVVVALGTQVNFGFRAAVESINRCLSALPGPVEITWQIGSTDVSGLGLDRPRSYVPAPEMVEAIRAADVVITHAGVGLVMLALQNGHRPVVLPRRPGRREHTDDHQAQLADFLGERGLAVVTEAPELHSAHLHEARRTTVRAVAFDALPPLTLRIS